MEIHLDFILPEYLFVADQKSIAVLGTDSLFPRQECSFC